MGTCHHYTWPFRSLLHMGTHITATQWATTHVTITHVPLTSLLHMGTCHHYMGEQVTGTMSALKAPVYPGIHVTITQGHSCHHCIKTLTSPFHMATHVTITLVLTMPSPIPCRHPCHHFAGTHGTNPHGHSCHHYTRTLMSSLHKSTHVT